MAGASERMEREELRPRRGCVPAMTVSTAGLPRAQQYEAWQDLGMPYLEMKPRAATPPESFEATGTARRFGPLLLYRVRLDGLDQHRSAAQIRRDGLDHWVVAICRSGYHHHHQQGGEGFVMTPGTPYLLSLAQPFQARRDGGTVEWLSLFVPRDATPHLNAALEAAQGRPIDGALGRILADHVMALDEHLDAVPEADAPRLAMATLGLLAAALTEREAEADRPQLDQCRLMRVKALIRQHLGSATLSPGRLAAMAGMSRSQLYRVFEPLGGVAGFIQRERLCFAYGLLAQPAPAPIGRIAEQAGFFEPSSFSRAFRHAFGVTPRDVRAAALSGAPLPAPKQVEEMAPGQLLTLLRGL